MANESEHHTSPTLLGRMRRTPPDQAAWSDFEQRYGKMIRRWCQRWGMQPSDAEDVTQDVLLALSRQMDRFEYDPDGRFRGWLKTITYRAWCDFLERRRRRRDAASGETVVMRLLESQEAQDDFLKQWEEEWKRELLEEAMKRVQGRVQPHTWEAFRLLTQDGLSGADVAAKLAMKPGAVWVAKSKVQKMIQQEIRRLEPHEHMEADAP